MPKSIVSKSQVLKNGYWPHEFLIGLVSPIPDIHCDWRSVRCTWNCPIHGPYCQVIRDHICGSGCPKCGVESSAYKRHLLKRSKNPFPDWFLKDLEGSPDKDKVLSGEFKTSDKVTFICPIHGPYLQTINRHLSGCRCPRCSVELRKHQIQVTKRSKNPFPDWFLKDLEGSPDKDKVLSGEFKTSDKVTFICPIHGPYLQTINRHLNGQGCSECGKLKSAKTRQQVHRVKNPFPQWFIDDLKGSPDKDKVLSGQLGVGDKVTFICPIHGPYLQLVSGHLSGKGCPKCARVQAACQYTATIRSKNPFPDWFLKDLEGSPDKDKVLSGHAKVHDKIIFICTTHGPYQQEINSHLNLGQGCPTCAANKVNWVSNIENKICQDLMNLGIRVVQSCRTKINSLFSGRPMELDLYLPDFKVAVECNGLYYHSFEYMESSRAYHAFNGKQNYHLSKLQACQQQGIQLLQFWEDTTRDHYDLVLNKILATCGLLKRVPLMARKLKISFIDSSWFQNYHIQATGRGTTIGLTLPDGTVVSAIQFRLAPKNEAPFGTFILDRYATDYHYFVIGGIERLMKFAERSFNVKYWVSYADKMISSGSLYIHLGFIKVSESKPDYQYVYKGQRYHKFNFRLKRFKNDPDLLYEEGLTESQLAELNNLTRVYDCGKIKYFKPVSC